MSGYVINPAERTITCVRCDDPALAELRNSDPQYLNDEGDVIYANGHGGLPEEQSYFVVEGIRSPLNGIALIVGTTENGDDCDATCAMEWLQEHVDFGIVVSIGEMRMFHGDRIVRQIQSR